MLQNWTATLPDEAHAAVLELVERNPTPAALEALLTCAKLLSNVAQDPAKYGCLPCKSRVLQERLLSRDGGEAAVIALGFDADLGAGSFIWTAPAEPREVACRAAAIRAAHDICVAVREEVVAVGNANAPRRAQDAISLCCTYVSNCLASDEARFRRIGAANKALCGRLLAASGGGMLLRAVGFAPEPVSSPIAFVCTHDAPTLRLVLATLNNAPAIWQALADEFAAASASSSAGLSPPPVRQSSAAPGPMQGVWGATFIALEAPHGGGDKVLLPPSALEAIGVLTEARHGTPQLPNPLCLRVECGDGRGTLGHGQPRRAAGRGQGGGGRLAGLLEFTAAEGHVALPRWLLQAVGAQEGVPLMLSSVDVPRASLVRLRPARTRFYEEAEDQQSLLQAGLHGVYTVLCCGETIRIANCGEEFELLVSEVCTGIPPTPVEAVCIVDVEALEVDMGESLEGEEERIAQERRAEETARAAQAAAQAAAAQAAAQAAAAEAEAARAAAAAGAHQAELAAWLPAEPQAAARGTVRVLVRLPTTRISRRFGSGATLQQVRTWVESALPETLHGALGDRFELVSTHPRYVSRAGEGGETTLEMAGLDGEQAMLNLRLLE